MKLCVLLIILNFIQRSCAVISVLSDEEHERMPSTFAVDSFARWLRAAGGRYCTAHVSYVADGDSPLLTMMQEYSAYTSSHFNHTRALLGTCVSQKCKEIEGNTILDQRSFLELCLNHTVWEEYKLKVKVDKEVFCHEHGEEKPAIAVVDVAVVATFFALMMCNLVGSLLDVFFPKQNGLISRVLKCFSIFSNWKRLTSPAEGSDKRLERLKGIYGIRAISTTGVIMSHAVMPAIYISENTKFVEDLYENRLFHLVLNGSIIMQTYLFLSAFLVVYLSQIHAEAHQISWRALPINILKRWLRLTPPYALVLALTATWQPRLHSGPVWDHMVESETASCRRDWWQNILYVNNYHNSLCMPTMWYLATDFQLYCLALVVMASCRTLVSRWLVLGGLFLAGMLAPALQTYLEDLDGPLLCTPAAGVTLFASDRTFNTVYKQAHANVPCYVLGIAAGYLVHWMQRNSFDAAKYKAWRPLYWLLFPLLVAIPLACKGFYTIPRVGIFYRVAAAALLKPVFGVVLALIFIGMIFKMEKLYRGVMEWRGWVPLGRVSYSAYLLQVAYLRISYGDIDAPIRTTHQRSSEIILLAIVVVYIAAYLFWLTVEAPLAQVVKTCFQTRGAGQKNDSDETPAKYEQNKKIM